MNTAVAAVGSVVVLDPRRVFTEKEENHIRTLFWQRVTSIMNDSHRIPTLVMQEFLDMPQGEQGEILMKGLRGTFYIPPK